MSSRFQPGQTVRWNAHLRRDIADFFANDDGTLMLEPPVARVVRLVEPGTDPEDFGICGECGGSVGPDADPRCPGPFVILNLWENEEVSYAEHELEEA